MIGQQKKRGWQKKVKGGAFNIHAKDGKCILYFDRKIRRKETTWSQIEGHLYLRCTLKKYERKVQTALNWLRIRTNDRPLTTC
jgi:hypothetical protein